MGWRLLTCAAARGPAEQAQCAPIRQRGSRDQPDLTLEIQVEVAEPLRAPGGAARGTATALWALFGLLKCLRMPKGAIIEIS